MRIEDFPLAWRWTDSSHTVLPPDALAQLTPLDGQQTDYLYRQGEELFSDAHTSLVDYPAKEFSPTQEWLRKLPVASDALVFLVWGRDTGISLPWHTFVEYWDDFCYSSSDDAFIFAESGRCLLAWNHYELFQYVESTV